MSKGKKRLTIGVLLLLLPLFVFVAPVRAHANLIQSVPEVNASLDRSPAQIELFFSESVEPSFSTIQVIDGNGNRVDNDDTLVDPAYPAHVTVSLRSLPDGVYTVSWQVLSSVDSHITAGAFPFAVGDVDAATLAEAAQASRQVKISPGEVVVRWLTYLTSLALAGGMLFMLLVWQPAYEANEPEDAIRPPWRSLASISLVILLLANILWLLVQGGQATRAEIAAPWNPALAQILFNTRFGILWLSRIALAMILVGLLLAAEPKKRERWASLGIGWLLLLTISLGSHAAAQPNPLLPILSDWVHLAAASAWVGGLIFFVVALFSIRGLTVPDRTRLTSALIPRFSALALVSVSVLVLSGLYASFLHLSSIADLTATLYGRTLLVKLALVLPMVLLGAVNLLITSPGMKRAAATGGSATSVGRFRRLVTSEVALGVAVLFSVGLLTTFPPARVVATAPMLSGTEEVEDLKVSLEVTPGRPGLNAFLVTVLSGGEPVSDAREVSLLFTPTTVELPTSNAQLTAQGNGEYRIEGGFLSLPDNWQLQVAVRRSRKFDAFANFDFSVGTTVTAQTLPWYRVSAVLLVVTALAYLFAFTPFHLSRGQSLAFARVPTWLWILMSFLLLLNPPIDEATNQVNPIPPNSASLASGEVLYQENCLPCHGSKGAGDGPAGLALNPPPADLTIHTAPGIHPDIRLFNWISDGFQNSPMPAFRERLTEEERWHLVNYIRTLAIQ